MLSILLPVYNEEAGIKTTLAQCQKAKNTLISQKIFKDVEIIVIDDASNDTTSLLLEEEEGIVVCRHKYNRGYGAALMSGLMQARGDTIAILDADGTYDPSDLICLSASFFETGADLVVGTRMLYASKMPLLRKAGNLFFARLVSFATRQKITDAASGMRMIKRVTLEALLPLPEDLSFAFTMSLKALRSSSFRVCEIPIRYTERKGISKLSIPRDGLIFLWRVLSIFKIQ